MSRNAWMLQLAGMGLAGFMVAACGGATENGPDVIGPGVQAERAADGTILNDGSMCNWQGQPDVEVQETAGPGAIQPNVRRVWKVFGEGADRRRVLACREVDTNLDGVKDVVRTYNEDGQSKEERADTNYDGKIDTWNVFSGGRIAEIRLDKNFDGEPDEWKTFTDGKLSKIKRDSNYDKKPDTWEMYRKGRLERMGVDLDGDERVDRWDHDSQWRKKIEKEEEAKKDAEDKKKQEELERREKEALDAAEAEGG
ncbi:MAG: hypothetical protein KC731_36175 [Myxococcales bacterium]|nr:hypothetical protein [Myxococcales bacterium]